MNSIYKNYCIDFEYYCVKQHQLIYQNEITYHWSKIPEEVLFKSGFITDYHNIRIKRINDYNDNKLNTIQEYGLDAISFDKINNKYNVLQIKCYEPNAVIDANTIGTFISCFFQRINIKYPLSLAYLYYTCKLSRNLQIDILNSNKIIDIKIDNIDDIINNKNVQQIELRYYQKEALEIMNNNIINDLIPKLLIMPDGTGKKLLLYHYLMNKTYKNIIIISSLKVDFNYLFIKLKNEMKYTNFISVIYDSSYEILNNYININDTILIAIDCHNINNELCEVIKQYSNVLLLTSSPEIKINEIINSELLYEYKYCDAIRDKYLCDYMLYLPVIEEVDNDIPNEIKNTIKYIDNNLYKKALFLINGMLQKGSRNCITFMTSINECYLFEEVIKNVMEKYHGLPYKTYSITCDKSNSERIRIMNDFENYKDERLDTFKILCSIRILDENISFTKCDAIFISNLTETSNNIKILQRISKGNRIDKDNINKICNCFVWSDNIYNSIGILEVLKYNDVEFENKIKYISKNYDNNRHPKIIAKLNKNNEDICKYVNINCISIIELWRQRLNEVIKYIDENNKKPKSKFILIQNKYYEKKSGIMKNEEIYNEYTNFLNKYKKYFYSEDELWEYYCNLLFEYCDETDKIPYINCKYKDEFIGKWLEEEIQKINSINDEKYIKLSKNILIRVFIYEIIKYKLLDNENWEFNCKLLFDFCNLENRVPYKKELFYYKNIGKWYWKQKKRINSIKDEKYIKLSKNYIVKQSLNNIREIFIENYSNELYNNFVFNKNKIYNDIFKSNNN